MMELSHQLSTIQQFKLPNLQKETKSEAGHISDLAYVSNHVCMLLKLISSLTINTAKSDDEKAMLMGHMIHIYKLYDSSIYLIIDDRTEISYILLRTLCEVVIKLKYLVKNINCEMCDKFKKASLVYDKKLWELIEKNKGTSIKDIESRMLNSIEKTFRDAGYELEDIDFKKDKNWCPNILELAKSVGLSDVYESFYRMSSTAVHSSWTHHQKYNISTINDTSKPRLEYLGAKPQPIEGASLLVLNLAKDYLYFHKDQSINKIINEAIEKLIRWFEGMSKRYDAFLSK